MDEGNLDYISTQAFQAQGERARLMSGAANQDADAGEGLFNFRHEQVGNSLSDSLTSAADPCLSGLNLSAEALCHPIAQARTSDASHVLACGCERLGMT